jgi:hypothetical protein
MGFFSGWKKITVVSYGLIYLFFNLWVIFHVNQYFPNNPDAWFKIFVSYGLLNALIFANADLRNKLFDVKFIKFLPRMLIFTIVSSAIFMLLIHKIDPLAQSTFGAISTLPIWLVLVHCITFATTESIIWQGYLDNQIGQPWSALTAGFFHWGVWSGGALVVIIGAGILFTIFSLVHYYLKKNNSDFAPVIGVHTGWNLVKVFIGAV